MNIIFETDLLELARWWMFFGLAGVFFNNFLGAINHRIPSIKDDLLVLISGPAFWVAQFGLWLSKPFR